MASARATCLLGLLLALAVGRGALADYESHPELRPDARCKAISTGIEDPKDPGGHRSIHCQRLFWDLPAASRLGFTAVAAPAPNADAPWYLNGLTDRPPPLFILDRNHDGIADDGQGYESAGPGRVRLCGDPDLVPWWKPVFDPQGKPVEGADPTTGRSGPLFTVACRRGTRVRFGPWQIGRSPQVEDDIAEGVVRFENSSRLDHDVARGLLDPKKSGRVEWHTATEFYTHLGTHHAVCWTPENAVCNNPRDPWSASDASKCIRGYQDVADGPEGPHGKGACYAGDQDTRCRKPDETGESVRDYAMFAGRVYFSYGPGQAEIALEDQLWDCYQHLLSELPGGLEYHVLMPSFGLDGRHADYRQQGGLVNVADVPIGGAAPGKPIGGAVGELIMQYFTEALSAPGYAARVPSESVRKGGLTDFLQQRSGTPHSAATPRTGER